MYTIGTRVEGWRRGVRGCCDRVAVFTNALLWPECLIRVQGLEGSGIHGLATPSKSPESLV